MARSIVERAIGAPLVPKVSPEKGRVMMIARISKLPDGMFFTLSTEPGRAFSEEELREELKLKHPTAMVEDIISAVKRLR